MGRPTNESKKEAKYLSAIYRLRQLVIKDYSVYCKLVHTDAQGNMQWREANHLMYLCQEVQKFLEMETTNPYDILIINTPPQVGKSLTLSETLPSWYIGQHPDAGVLIVSYNDEFAQRFGRKNLDKVQQFGEKLFDVKVSKKKASNNAFEIEGNKGQIVSAGINSGNLTGNPARLLIIDDPIRNSGEAKSITTRNSIWAEWQGTLRTRIPAGGKVILIMTRWHEDDLAGRFLEHEKDNIIKYIKLPIECVDENDELCQYLAKLNPPVERKLNDSLCPDLVIEGRSKDNNWKDNLKKTILGAEGLAYWNALYQGEPSSESGNLVKREWWKFYKVLPEIHRMFMSVDCTFKGEKKNDKVAIEVWGMTGANIYLIDLVNQQMTFTETVDQIENMKNKYPMISSVFIEGKANGPAVIDTLRPKIKGIIDIEPKGDKYSRLDAVTYLIRAGNVHLPQFAQFTEEFIDQCSSFPKGKFDDMVDAMSQCLAEIGNYKTHAPLGKAPRDDFRLAENDGQKHKLFGFKVPSSFMRF